MPREPVSGVVVDIGTLSGALLVTARPEDCGREIEIEAIGPRRARTHVWVLARESSGAISYSALFPRLRPGRYLVLGNDRGPSEVEVVAGTVTTTRWTTQDSEGEFDDAS